MINTASRPSRNTIMAALMPMVVGEVSRPSMRAASLSLPSSARRVLRTRGGWLYPGSGGPGLGVHPIPKQRFQVERKLRVEGTQTGLGPRFQHGVGIQAGRFGQVVAAGCNSVFQRPQLLTYDPRSPDGSARRQDSGSISDNRRTVASISSESLSAEGGIGVQGLLEPGEALVDQAHLGLLLFDEQRLEHLPGALGAA